jgi:hypothetical protein
MRLQGAVAGVAVDASRRGPPLGALSPGGMPSMPVFGAFVLVALLKPDESEASYEERDPRRGQRQRLARFGGQQGRADGPAESQSAKERKRSLEKSMTHWFRWWRQSAQRSSVGVRVQAANNYGFPRRVDRAHEPRTRLKYPSLLPGNVNRSR